MTGWQEDEKGLLEDAGDVGGDAQVGPAYSRRFWATDVPSFLFESVDVFGYAARHAEGAPTMVQLQWCYSICSDRNDPGGTEQWADYLCEDVGVVGAGGVPLATELAREKVSQLAVEDFAAKAEEICRRAAMPRLGR